MIFNLIFVFVITINAKKAKWEYVTCECSINVSVNGVGSLFLQRQTACPYPAEDARIADYEPFTDRYDPIEDRYYCKVLGGHCIDIVYYNPVNNSLINGFPCHERSCANKMFRLKGCAVSDDLVLETYMNDNKERRHSYLPKPESTCIGDYGISKKRKDGTFYMNRDWGMAGIAHVPTRANCEPICAGPTYHDEKLRCTDQNTCNWSRIFCCNTTLCNSQEQMTSGSYYNAPYDVWMDRLEESLLKKRVDSFNSTGGSQRNNISAVIVFLIISVLI